MVTSVVKSSNLANTRCAKRREFDFETNTEKTNNYKKSVIIKDIIKKYFEGEIDCNDIPDAITERFKELNYESEHQRASFAHESIVLTQRLIDSLRSSRKTPQLCAPMELTLFDVDVLVSADCLFVSQDVVSGQKCIEVVKIRCSRPSVTQAGTKRDSSALNSMELYAMLKYGQKYADMMIKPGETMKVMASYIFMKSSKDSNGAIDLTLNLYEDKKTHVYITEPNYYPGMTLNESVMDQIFKPQFEEYYIGDTSCNAENCENCDFNQLCNYKLSPKYVVKEKVQKSIRDLNLTPQQEGAIYFKKGVCRINAGAGAGKTLVVALHVTMMILDGVAPESIMCLTFTNAGASEMKERIALYVADINPDLDISGLTVTTFNAYADTVVGDNYELLGFSAKPTLIDDIERAAIVAELLNTRVIDGLNYKMFAENSKYVKGALPMCTKAFDIIKKEKLSIGDERILEAKLGADIRFISLTALPQLLELYGEYDARLRAENLIEFADQELLMFEVLAQNPYYFEKFDVKHVIVDEFQDSNQQQLDLIKEFMDCPAFESLMVVGDDSQSIFSFRDTSPEFIINFFEVIGEDGEDFYLLENHRSTPQIIEFANKINALNKNRVAKDLIATRPSGKPVVVSGFFSKEEELTYVSEKIKEKIDAGTNPDEIAYIAGDKYALLDMGSRLTELGVQWIMLNPEPVLENAKVIAAIELSKAVGQPDATNSILVYLNALYEGKLMDEGADFMKNAINELQKQLEELNTLSDKEKRERFYELLLALDDDDELYQAFIENLKRKTSFKSQMKYLHNYMLYGKNITFKRNKEYPGVVLTTAHSSKGLEWPIVFNSISKYDSQMLHSRSVHYDKDALTEEKRRLFFVSATRARDELYVTGEYVAFGNKDERVYNQFLKEAYDAVGAEFNPIDPMEEIRAAEAKERAKEKARERRAKKKAELEAKTKRNVAAAIAAANLCDAELAN